MAKHTYVLIGPQVGAQSGNLVTKELATFEGDSIKLEDGFVKILDNEAEGLTVGIIRLDDGQAIKRAS